MIDFHTFKQFTEELETGNLNPDLKWKQQEEQYLIYIVTELIKAIHIKKSNTYKNSWKKHGWMGSIFPNIARKFDRIEGIFKDPDLIKKFVTQPNENNTEECILDTFLDSSVYNILAFTEFIRQHPNIFIKWLHDTKIFTDGEDSTSIQITRLLEELINKQNQGKENVKG